MSDCPSCGGELTSSDKFCGQCGALVPEPDSGGALSCAACGEPLDAEAFYCGYCGAAVASSADDEATTIVDDPAPDGDEVPPNIDEPTLVAEAPTLVAPAVAEAPTEVLTPAPAGAHSSRNKTIAVIAGIAAVAAVIAGVALWRGGDDPPSSPSPSDAAAPAYTYDETTPATGYEDPSSSEGVPDLEADALTEEAMYGVWSGSLYVEKVMDYGDRWKKSDLEYQSAYISISPYDTGTYGEFTVEPTSGDSFTGDVTEITIEDDVATIRIEYADVGAGASLRVSLQDGSILVGFYEDDPPPDSNWVSWKGDVELTHLIGE